MRIISFIDQWDVILRILKHLDLWPPPARDPPDTKTPDKIKIMEHEVTYDFDFFG